MKRIDLFVNIVFCVFLISNAYAQESNKDKSEITSAATAAANPIIKDFAGIPIQFNLNFGTADYNRIQTLMILEPFIPYRLKGKFYVVSRLIFTAIQQPGNEQTGSTYGIGNSNFSTFFCAQQSGVFSWGVGAAVNIPTASSPELGANAFGIGPTIILLLKPKKAWILGLISNQIWSYKTSDLSTFYCKYFITHNFKNGWFVNSTPTIIANFNAANGEQWTVPVGAGAGKIVHFSNLPVKFQLQAYYNVIKPTESGDYSIHATVALFFPKACD